MDTAVSLKILPAYTGSRCMADALCDARATRLLWLEILLNPTVDWTPWSAEPAVAAAYQKACRWRAHFTSLLDASLSTPDLPLDHGPIDLREYRTFVEALRFVSAQHTTRH